MDRESRQHDTQPAVTVKLPTPRFLAAREALRSGHPVHEGRHRRRPRPRVRPPRRAANRRRRFVL